MKKVIFIIFGMLLLCHACIEDESTLPDKPISEITISADFDTLSIDFGMELVYEPQIEQTGDLDLTYEWSYSQIDKKGNRDSLRFLSNERVLRHQFKKLGNYDLRLKVSNEHGSAFKKYALRVRAYDEGIFVLSKDDAGKGRVSFMRSLSREELEEGMEETFNTDVFSSVNPGYALNDPVDVKKIDSDIFLLSRGDNLVYRIDGQTFEMYNTTDFKEEYPGTQPSAIVSMDRSITAYLVWSKEGNCVKVDYQSDVAFKSDWSWGPTDKMYDRVLKVKKNMRCYSFFLNYEDSRMYYTHGYPTYGSISYEYTAWFPKEELINIYMDNDFNVYLITCSKENPNQIYHRMFGFDNDWNNKRQLDRASYMDQKYTVAEPITLTRESQVQYNSIYGYIFYTNKDKMYRWKNDWYYYQPIPQTPVITLEGKEITCFEFSPDEKQLYLGVYDPSLPDLKGCVYVYDADKLDPETRELTLLKKYEGVADRPIKVFWKNK